MKGSVMTKKRLAIIGGWPMTLSGQLVLEAYLAMIKPGAVVMCATSTDFGLAARTQARLHGLADEAYYRTDIETGLLSASGAPRLYPKKRKDGVQKHQRETKMLVRAVLVAESTHVVLFPNTLGTEIRPTIGFCKIFQRSYEIVRSLPSGAFSVKEFHSDGRCKGERRFRLDGTGTEIQEPLFEVAAAQG